MDSMEGVATVSVPKSKAMYSSGAKKGRLRKGCRWSGRGARCTPDVAARLGVSKGKAKKGRKRGGRGQTPMNLRPKSPMAAQNRNVFLALQESRTRFRKMATTCEEKKWSGRKIIQALQYMMRLPAKGKLDLARRNKRYHTEMERVAKETIGFCNKQGTRTDWRAGAASGGGFTGHPCASPNPPKWCNKKKSKR